MLLSDLIADEDLDRFRDLRWHAYADRAADFLRRHFPRAVSLLGDSELQAAIRDAAAEAHQTGFRSERDHLSFLIVRVMLGRRFRWNPAYQDLLHEAGWIEDDGHPARHIAFAPLFQQIEIWDERRAADLASTHRLVARFASLCQTTAPKGTNALQYVLPQSAGHLHPTALAAFTEAAMANAQSAGLRRGAASAYACAALLLGLGYHTDPFHPGIARALIAHPGDADQTAMAFAVALRQVLMARLGQEDIDAA